jgi:hypothetical protein
MTEVNPPKALWLCVAGFRRVCLFEKRPQVVGLPSRSALRVIAGLQTWMT